ncbi:hypothetical protein [Lacibacter sp. H407]|uniref:hypothetical protein n=1 Tax=Lacibacter sp. H407 TaxID=3133423 RepID=UPI0030C33A75
MTKLKLTDVTTKIVDLLLPFESEERHRVMQASFTLLGEVNIKSKSKDNGSEEGEENEVGNGFSRLVTTWMKQNGITNEAISEVFHIDGEKADVIASDIPGKFLKTKTINAYVLQGIADFLTSGIPNFDDKTARSLCENSGCYDTKNHAKYIREKGNVFTGSADSGWKLTSPGLKHGASIIKEITQK